jgi:hypothetical protein
VGIIEQYLVLQLWRDHLGSRTVSNEIVREFYLDVIKSSDLYSYGVAYEVLDIVTNGVFDLRVAGSWNRCGALRSDSLASESERLELGPEPVAAA